MHADTLWHNYLVARRRWRSFTGKKSRFVRRGFRRKGAGTGKGSSKGKGSPFSSSSFGGRSFFEHPVDGTIDPGEQYFGKGSKGSGKSRQNPRGSDGQIMKCLGCNSETHLIKDCPVSYTHLTLPTSDLV